MYKSDKIELSYSTMNALVNCPHTWLNKINKLERFENPYMTAGKENHRILQESVSGVRPNDLFKDLPTFELVETRDFDPKMKFIMEWNEKYRIFGYADGLNTDKTVLLEFKSGKKWTAGDFARLVQWKIGALCIPTVEKVWLANAPISQENWNKETIKTFNVDVTDKNRQEAREFIEKAINMIENINDQDLFVEQRSRYCYFVGCPWGCSKNES